MGPSLDLDLLTYLTPVKGYENMGSKVNRLGGQGQQRDPW